MLEIKKFSEYINECGTCGCEEPEGEKDKDKVDCGDPKTGKGDKEKECNESLNETKSFEDFFNEKPKEDEEQDDKEEGNVKNFNEFFN